MSTSSRPAPRSRECSFLTARAGARVDIGGCPSAARALIGCLHVPQAAAPGVRGAREPEARSGRASEEALCPGERRSTRYDLAPSEPPRQRPSSALTKRSSRLPAGSVAARALRHRAIRDGSPPLSGRRLSAWCALAALRAEQNTGRGSGDASPPRKGPDAAAARRSRSQSPGAECRRRRSGGRTGRRRR